MLNVSRSIMKNHRSQVGFTLLEVLVTLIVMAVGLLGLAGLQVLSLRANHESYLRGQAIVQAYDIADRMRANPSGVNNDNYDYGGVNLGTENLSCETKKDASGGCTAQQMALNDLFRWNEANRAGLPSGIGIICRDSTLELEEGEDIFNGVSNKVSGCDGAAGAWVVKLWWVDDRTNTVSRYITSLGIGL